MTRSPTTWVCPRQSGLAHEVPAGFIVTQFQPRKLCHRFLACVAISQARHPRTLLGQRLFDPDLFRNYVSLAMIRNQTRLNTAGKQTLTNRKPSPRNR